MPYITHPLYTVANKQTAGRGVGAGPEADWTLTETSQFVVESRVKTSGLAVCLSVLHTLGTMVASLLWTPVFGLQVLLLMSHCVKPSLFLCLFLWREAGIK